MKNKTISLKDRDRVILGRCALKYGRLLKGCLTTFCLGSKMQLELCEDYVKLCKTQMSVPTCKFTEFMNCHRVLNRGL